MTHTVLYTFFLLCIWAQVKHFLADYILQNHYMLGKFREKGWILPLAAHSFVHFLFTFGVAYVMIGDWGYPLFLALVDFTIHFAMDRIKASPQYLGKYTMLSKMEMRSIIDAKSHPLSSAVTDLLDRQLRSNRNFWWSLGLDQMVHHITDICLMFLLVYYFFNM